MDEKRRVWLQASLACCDAYWAAQGSPTAEEKRRKLEEETYRRHLVATAETAAGASPAEWRIEQIRSGEAERLRAEGRRNYWRNQGTLARWRREGYTFDAEHRLVAPRQAATIHRGSQERRPATTPRRTRIAASSGSGGDPPQSDDDPPGGLSQPLADVAAARDRRVSYTDVSARLNVALEWHNDGAEDDAWAVVNALREEVDRDLRDDARAVA